MLYLDTSAVVKLIRPEAESEVLVGFLNRQSVPWVTSVITELEVVRALRRTNPELLGNVPAVIARLSRYDVDDVVRATASAYPDPDLRSLDAIHLATADAVFRPHLTGFLVYDVRLGERAAALGLPVVSPGS
jgi:predicted nucleic acid-binding protein